MKQTFLGNAILTLVVTAALPAAAAAETSKTLKLQTRFRIESPKDSGKYRIVYKTVEWEAKQTAIIITLLVNALFWAMDKPVSEAVGAKTP